MTIDAFAALPQALRDAAYDNTAAVADSARQLQDFERRSARVAADPGAQLDIRYGAAERQVFDFLPGARHSHTLLFIHGGYWQMRHKNTFRFVTEGARCRGLGAALLGYTLAPQAGLATMVAQVRAGIAAIGAHARQQGGSGRILLCGWSAGAHLTAMGLSSPEVIAGLGISGIYDLQPIRHTYLNQALSLTEQDALALSPLSLPRVDKAFVAAFGTAELAALQAQTAAFSAYRSGCAGEMIAVENADHFSILNALAAPDGVLLEALLAHADRQAPFFNAMDPPNTSPARKTSPA